jgi:hypothetical protein
VAQFREKSVTLRAAVRGTGPAAPGRPPAPPVRPASIFVYGLEGGTRQIPYGLQAQSAPR